MSVAMETSSGALPSWPAAAAGTADGGMDQSAGSAHGSRAGRNHPDSRSRGRLRSSILSVHSVGQWPFKRWRFRDTD